MAIFVDTASADDLRATTRLGFVSGFTTNPILMARETDRPLEHFERLLSVCEAGPAFYQPTGDEVGAFCDEARTAVRMAPERVVVKCPATPIGVEAAAMLTGDGTRCALTAVYAPAQALLAHEVGCAWAILMWTGPRGSPPAATPSSTCWRPSSRGSRAVRGCSPRA